MRRFCLESRSRPAGSFDVPALTRGTTLTTDDVTTPPLVSTCVRATPLPFPFPSPFPSHSLSVASLATLALRFYRCLRLRRVPSRDTFDLRATALALVAAFSTTLVSRPRTCESDDIPTQNRCPDLPRKRTTEERDLRCQRKTRLRLAARAPQIS